MSQDFKLRFDEMKQGNPAKPDGATVDKEFFEKNTHVRNLCFIWPDNKKQFFNYAYLISGEYSPDECCITLWFTTHTVMISGSELERLFEDLVEHLPSKIRWIDKRYKTLSDDVKYIIEGIKVIANS